MKKTLLNTAKLAVAGATIFAIGWAISVGDPDDGVQEADADIGTWVSTQTLYNGDFGKTVAALGMKPRAYEMNGNQVFFGVGRVEASPHEVLEHYQEQFVAAGINEREFLQVPDGKFERSLEDLKSPQDLTEEELAYNRAMLTGGVVPVAERPGYVAMGGIVPKGQYSELEELVAEWSEQGDGALHGMMDGFRFIDAQQFPGQKYSRITSVWADEEFDSRKMADPKKYAGPPVLTAPVCMGCDVGMQMKSLSPKEPYRIGHFYSQRSTRDLVGFYNNAMPHRGFAAGDSNAAIEIARQYLGSDVPDGAVLQFTNAQGLESLITVFEDPKLKETSVVIVESLQ